MDVRKQLIDYCLTLPGAYEDYPFDDFNWTVMRHGYNKKTFALIFELDGKYLGQCKVRAGQGGVFAKCESERDTGVSHE